MGAGAGNVSTWKGIFLPDIPTCICRPCLSLQIGSSGGAQSGERTVQQEEGKMKLEEILKKIRPADRKSMEEARARWRTVGKPLFSLGRLEDAVIRMAGIKGT